LREVDLRRLLLLAQADAFTGVGTGAGDALDLRHAALRRGWHTHPGGGVLHITHGALGYRCRRAGRWSGEDGDRRGGRDRDRESTGKNESSCWKVQNRHRHALSSLLTVPSANLSNADGQREAFSGFPADVRPEDVPEEAIC
jgi:hypothetical protein